MQKTSKFALLSVMLCFFTMGFVDLVGIASNYVQKDLELTHAQASIMPSLVFFWFLIFSVPTGMLMNKIGRKKTVLLSIIVTVLSLILPLCGESYALMLCAFSLLGIGNALMQTSLNPLVSNIVTGNLSSTLTFGQFVKAIASFLAPYIAMWGATAAIPHMGLGWKVLFPIYAIIGIVAILALAFTSIHEEPVAKGSSFAQCFPPLFLRHHVPCGHRCRYQHYGAEDPHGAARNGLGGCRICHLALLHLPYHRLPLRLGYPASYPRENLLRYLRMHDYRSDDPSRSEPFAGSPLYRYRPRRIR